MTVEQPNFIKAWDSVVDEAMCTEFIELFDTLADAGLAKSRQELNENMPQVFQDDKAIDAGELVTEARMRESNLGMVVSDILQKALIQYCREFKDTLQPTTMQCYDFKFQKTDVGGGFHAWHNENSQKGNRNRVLAWTIYLNNVETGGETEFLHQHIRINAVAGRLAVWPADWTYTHRGNPPISNAKYILTGWYEV